VSYTLSLDKTLRLPCQAELTCNLQFIRMEYEICMQNSGQASSQRSSISVTLQNSADLAFVKLPHAPCSPAFSLSYTVPASCPYFTQNTNCILRCQFSPTVTNLLPKYALHIHNQVTYKNTHENTRCTLTNGPFYITTKPVLHTLLSTAAVYTALP
jgi:hypothetical protein